MFDSTDIYQRDGALVVRRITPVAARAPAVRLTEFMSMNPPAETLAEIDAYDAAELDEGKRVMLLALWERLGGWLVARQQQAIVDVAGPAPAEPPPRRALPAPPPRQNTRRLAARIPSRWHCAMDEPAWCDVRKTGDESQPRTHRPLGCRMLGAAASNVTGTTTRPPDDD